MSGEKKDLVCRFIDGIQNMMLGMQQVDNSCMEAFGDIAKREFGLLIKLGQSEHMIMREVSDFLQIPMSTSTGIVDKLIEKKFVERSYSPEDRRIVIIQLSKEGRCIYEMLNEKLYVYGKALLETFATEEKNQFVEYMERAFDATSKMETPLV
ncbi:MAG: MarR family transcriptional regulator [Cyclobacteriaceae bacterium]